MVPTDCNEQQVPGHGQDCEGLGLVPGVRGPGQMGPHPAQVVARASQLGHASHTTHLKIASLASFVQVQLRNTRCFIYIVC